MLISIFTRQAPKIGPFEFDAIFQDVLESNVQPALYPIEIGADASDHVIRLPKIYSITGGVSNTPLTLGRDTLASLTVGALSNFFNSSVAAQVSGLLAGFLAGSDDTRASATLSALLAIQAAGQPFDLTSGDVSLTNMLITNVRRTRTPETEEGFTFTADLQEMPLISTVLQQNQPLSDQLPDDDPVKTQATQTINRGEVSTSTLTNENYLNDITEFFS